MVCKKYQSLTFSPTSTPHLCKILIGGPTTERQVVKASHACMCGSHDDRPLLDVFFGQLPWKPSSSLWAGSA